MFKSIFGTNIFSSQTQLQEDKTKQSSNSQTNLFNSVNQENLSFYEINLAAEINQFKSNLENEKIADDYKINIFKSLSETEGNKYQQLIIIADHFKKYAISSSNQEKATNFYKNAAKFYELALNNIGDKNNNIDQVNKLVFNIKLCNYHGGSEYIPSLVYLAEYYSDKNIEQAIKIYEKIIFINNKKSTTEYLEDKYVFKALQLKIQVGNEYEDYLNLGKFYEQGTVITRDIKEANRLYKKAGDLLYNKAKESKKNQINSSEEYKKAAYLGSVSARNKIIKDFANIELNTNDIDSHNTIKKLYDSLNNISNLDLESVKINAFCLISYIQELLKINLDGQIQKDLESLQSKILQSLIDYPTNRKDDRNDLLNIAFKPYIFMLKDFNREKLINFTEENQISCSVSQEIINNDDYLIILTGIDSQGMIIPNQIILKDQFFETLKHNYFINPVTRGALTFYTPENSLS